MPTEENANEFHEDTVTPSSEPRHVRRASALHESRTLDEVRSRRQRSNEEGNFRRIFGAVGIDRDDDVASRRLESCLKRVALARITAILHGANRRQEVTCHFYRIVRAMVIDQYDFVRPGRNPWQYVEKIFRLI